MRPLLWCGALNSPGQDRLDPVEQVLGDQWFEVAAFSANAVLGDVHDAYQVNTIVVAPRRT